MALIACKEVVGPRVFRRTVSESRQHTPARVKGGCAQLCPPELETQGSCQVPWLWPGRGNSSREDSQTSQEPHLLPGPPCRPLLVRLGGCRSWLAKAELTGRAPGSAQRLPGGQWQEAGGWSCSDNCSLFPGGSAGEGWARSHAGGILALPRPGHAVWPGDLPQGALKCSEGLGAEVKEGPPGFEQGQVDSLSTQPRDPLGHYPLPKCLEPPSSTVSFLLLFFLLLSLLGFERFLDQSCLFLFSPLPRSCLLLSHHSLPDFYGSFPSEITLDRWTAQAEGMGWFARLRCSHFPSLRAWRGQLGPQDGQASHAQATCLSWLASWCGW